MLSDNYTSIIITEAHLAGGNRLDKLMATLWQQHSRTVMQSLVRLGAVTLDGKVCCRISQSVLAGQVLQVSFAELPPTIDDCAPEAVPLDIIYEDEALLVVNKPAGLVSHPGHGNWRGTLQAGVLYHHAEAKALPRGGLVHRLDKDTSGLLAVAKTLPAQQHLIEQFKTREIQRVYLALTYGTPPATGVVNLPIGRHRHHPIKMAVCINGKEAITHFVVEKQWRNFALVRCFLKTGRTHQIRVHLAHSGYPIVGDPLYDNRGGAVAALPLNRQALHATHLRLVHPTTERVCEWDCPPPPDILATIAELDESISSSN